ncbi:Ankyrin repeats (many copies) [Phytophthora infestans]|uniref:Ankyrin repeats (Many copies) n=1 Tax=Phytophthora infestans TaxID=4787 RepID=A0A833T233_PHYIN|nr:Ankyrin repeats (many copies) [Phytophthora infestans]
MWASCDTPRVKVVTLVVTVGKHRDTNPALTYWYVQSFHVDFLAEAIYEPRDAFVYAASLNQVEVVRRWIGKRLNINELDKDGSHALFSAAQNESLAVLELLLTNGANVNQQQANGKTALTQLVRGANMKLHGCYWRIKKAPAHAIAT